MIPKTELREAQGYSYVAQIRPIEERLPSVTEHLESIDWTSRKVREDVLELLQREAIPVESSGRPDIELLCAGFSIFRWCLSWLAALHG